MFSARFLGVLCCAFWGVRLGTREGLHHWKNRLSMGSVGKNGFLFLFFWLNGYENNLTAYTIE